MQIFVLGKTKTGKSTLSAYLQKFTGLKIYEAGSWAREEFSLIHSEPQDEFSAQFKENLTSYALKRLAENPNYSFEKYKQWCEENHCLSTIITGVRNPDDFFNMSSLEDVNKIIFITSDKKFEGSLEFFEEGLEIIKKYIEWKNKINPFFEVIEIDEKEILGNSPSLQSKLKGLM